MAFINRRITIPIKITRTKIITAIMLGDNPVTWRGQAVFGVHPHCMQIFDIKNLLLPLEGGYRVSLVDMGIYYIGRLCHFAYWALTRWDTINANAEILLAMHIIIGSLVNSHRMLIYLDHPTCWQVKIIIRKSLITLSYTIVITISFNM